MGVSSDTASAAAPRCWFYGAAVILMLVGVAAAFVQKGYESNVAITGAKRTAAGVQETDESRNEVQQIIRDAVLWADLSLAGGFLGVRVVGRCPVATRKTPQGVDGVIVGFSPSTSCSNLMMV